MKLEDKNKRSRKDEQKNKKIFSYRNLVFHTERKEKEVNFYRSTFLDSLHLVVLST